MLKSIPSGEAGYEISGKGTIRFPASAPVPHGLVAELVKARARELQEANN